MFYYLKSKIKLTLIIFYSYNIFIFAQIENVPTINPIYDFLKQIETKGILPHYSLSQLPLQRKTIIDALKLARQNDSLLTNFEKRTLISFEKEFQIVPTEKAVAIYSNKDTNSVFSSRIWGDYDKSVYHYSDSTNNITIIPLASSEIITKESKTWKYSYDTTTELTSALLLGTLGFRLYGTLSNNFGYYLQITNSAVLKGDSSLALIDNKYATSKKFSLEHKDADMSESHIAYQNGDWFYTSFGRETRLFGAGLDQKLIINNNISPTFDAITLRAKFKTFEYTFSHNSLINFPEEGNFGFNTVIPPKYTAIHSFTFLPAWGEISFFETIIYSRDLDMAYLNPLSFFKNIEHNLHDRDNAGMGFTAVVRPIKNLQFKATWFLDDLKFSEIGNNYWGNKTAWNISTLVSLLNVNLGLEYTRVEPYTFTHFNPQNSNTTDSMLYSSTLQPNSDRITAIIDFWWGERYPIQIKYSHTRHGSNIYDDEGNLVLNVGGNIFSSNRWGDNIYVNFLDGRLEYSNRIDITAGYEIFRGLSVHLSYSNFKINEYNSYFRVLFRLYDF